MCIKTLFFAFAFINKCFPQLVCKFRIILIKINKKNCLLNEIL